MNGVAALTLALSLAAAPVFGAEGAKDMSRRISPSTLAEMERLFHYAGPHSPIVSAHRGGQSDGFGENTIDLLAHMLETMPAIFEVDARFTADGALILMHDPTLERTTDGRGVVRANTLAEVEALYVKDWRGELTAAHPPTLEKAIAWSKGKTLLNLDIKDSTPEEKVALVKRHDAFANILFTVHSPEEARYYLNLDQRCHFAAVVFNMDDLNRYEAMSIAWPHVAIAYVGPRDKPELRPLYAALHRRAVMVMVATATSYDRLPTAQDRSDAYRALLANGIDIIESDRPDEVWKAVTP